MSDLTLADVEELTRMVGIFDIFTDPRDALEQMGHYIREQQEDIQRLQGEVESLHVILRMNAKSAARQINELESEREARRRRWWRFGR